MSRYQYEGYGVIRDIKTDILYHRDYIPDLLEGKDIRIEKLQKQLKEANETIQSIQNLIEQKNEGKAQ